MALGLAIGTLVDNSIVVLESIHRHRIQGKSLREASIEGAGEIALGVSASATTNIVVFVPIAFIGGVVGMLVSSFALTMAFATLVSLFISFTLTPILTSLLLSDKERNDNPPAQYIPAPTKRKTDWQTRFANVWEKGFGTLERSYIFFLKGSLSNRLITLSLAIAVFLGALTMARFLGTTMIPTPDRGEVTIQFEMPPGTPLNITSDLLLRIEKSVRKKYGDIVRGIYATAGKITARSGRSSEGTHVGELLVLFSDKNKRTQSMPEILHNLQSLKHETPGVVTILQTSPMGGTESPIQIDLFGDDLAQIDAYAKELENRMRGIVGAVSIDSTVRLGKPELVLSPEKDRLTDLGLTSVGLGMVMRMSLEGIVASVFRDKGSEYEILVKLDELDLEHVEEVGDIILQSISGESLPIRSVSGIEKRTSNAQIIRRDKRRIQNLSCDSSGRSMGEVVADIRKEAENMNMKTGYGIALAGQSAEMGDMFVKMVTVMILALVLTYLTLVAILESYIQPLTILLTFPLSIIGVLGALFVTRNSLGLFSMMSIVMLLGIVVNNAILIIDYTTELRKQGLERREALINACGVRLKPILMTTLTTVFGMLPIALGIGWGAELRAPMAIVSIGGLLVSTFLTAFVIPVVYTVFDDIAFLARKMLGS
jgi:HAE1 family hydrophobic/amphiphilic exporter-1